MEMKRLSTDEKFLNFKKQIKNEVKIDFDLDENNLKNYVRRLEINSLKALNYNNHLDFVREKYTENFIEFERLKANLSKKIRYDLSYTVKSKLEVDMFLNMDDLETNKVKMFSEKEKENYNILKENVMILNDFIQYLQTIVDILKSKEVSDRMLLKLAHAEVLGN